mmetsp:Transcript_11780/g.35925  ORF Transcript_11780/g.35925 Transcript_11780/m.35925 type:complete len:123 (+) Transcript_11780:95-463(+)|eukprot:CAMPEP_0198724730 /NCGR_PEP_ID=MMETSP1475-20131203/2158_1 /TAXON_ID= ORGANISM="Unidentified sp., Strain CCMP1999" /NCGR_SAMPLE_ID=MMETSP1475 /ASSEMBLY_ACC=CAM_ASM_001111 /LENGTH=122 /DNA_ID=CAMNT_0044486337 /DNA_START=80 /DNA_END=448 /DNA_ORIENTATION=+
MSGVFSGVGFVNGGGLGLGGRRGRTAAVSERRGQVVCALKRLFVGGISWATDDDMLREAFAEYGNVLDARVIFDRETGRSRGFGFVTFEQDDDADQAIERMDGSELDGRMIRVNVAKRKQEM